MRKLKPLSYASIIFLFFLLGCGKGHHITTTSSAEKSALGPEEQGDDSLGNINSELTSRGDTEKREQALEKVIRTAPAELVEGLEILAPTPSCDCDYLVSVEAEALPEVDPKRGEVPIDLQKFFADRQLSFELPYRLENNKSQKNIFLNVMPATQANRNVQTPRKVFEYSVNSQGVFIFSLSRIMEFQQWLQSERNDVPHEFKQIEIELNLLKYSTQEGNYGDTEILCSNELRLCSGEIFRSEGWQELFKDDVYKTVNSLFIQKLQSHLQNVPVDSVDTFILDGTIRFNLAELFSSSSHLLIDDDILSKAQRGTLSFIIADDLYLVSPPRLILGVKNHSASVKGQ